MTTFSTKEPAQKNRTTPNNTAGEQRSNQSHQSRHPTNKSGRPPHPKVPEDNPGGPRENGPQRARKSGNVKNTASKKGPTKLPHERHSNLAEENIKTRAPSLPNRTGAKGKSQYMEAENTHKGSTNTPGKRNKKTKKLTTG